METLLIQAVTTLSFGGGLTVAIAYIYAKQSGKQLDHQKEQIERICASHEKNSLANAEAFATALARRDEDYRMLASEIRNLRRDQEKMMTSHVGEFHANET